MHELNYEVARSLIKSGDLINIYRSGRGLKPILHGFINFFTGSPIFHCVIAMWMKSPSGHDRLMCVETNLFGGKRIIPLSYYTNHRMEVIHIPETASFAAAEEEAVARVGKQKYGFFDLITIGVREFFGLPAKDLNGQVCSELCADLLVRMGVPLPSTHVSPGKLRNELGKLGLKPAFFIAKEH